MRTHCVRLRCGGISLCHLQGVKIIPHRAAYHIHLVKHGSLDKVFIIFGFEITGITFPLWVKKKRFKGHLVGPFQHCIRRLIILLPQMSSFIHLQRRYAPHRRERPLLAKELLPRNLASKSVIYESTRFFYMPQSWDMGQILSLPLRRGTC